MWRRRRSKLLDRDRQAGGCCWLWSCEGVQANRDGSFKERARAACPCASFTRQSGRIQQVSKQIARRDHFISTPGTAADRPDGRRGVHHLMAHLSESKERTLWGAGKGILKTSKEFYFPSSYPYLCKLCRVIEGDASGGRGCLARMILQHIEVTPLLSRAAIKGVEALLVPRRDWTASHNKRLMSRVRQGFAGFSRHADRVEWLVTGSCVVVLQAD